MTQMTQIGLLSSSQRHLIHLQIDRAALLGLAKEAEISPAGAGDMIDRMCSVASRWSAIATRDYQGAITDDTLMHIQHRIDENVALLR